MRRVTFDKELREKAKREDKGLVMIVWQTHDGKFTQSEHVAGPKTLRYVKQVLNNLDKRDVVL